MRRDAGSTTAEFAVVLPAIVALLALCLGGLQAGAVQLRMQDAVADAARALGRGETAEVAAERAARQLTGVELSSWRDGELVCARLDRSAQIGNGIPIPLSASGCALADGR